MDEIFALGVSWRRASASRLAAWTLPTDEQTQRLPALRDALGVRELVYLATCNRVEVVVAAEPDADARTLRGRLMSELLGPEDKEGNRELRVWGGEGAIEHLMLVATGLDSAQVGEREISGQMRRAVSVARDAGTVGPTLQWAFDQALRVGKKVQSERGVSTGRVSLAEVALDAVRATLAATPGAVALVGVSPMTERCAQSLAGERLVFVNRTVDKARPLAERYGGQTLSLAEFTRRPVPVRALISATAAPGVIIDGPVLEQLAAGGTRLLVDFAVPADIDKAAADRLDMARIDMDEVTARAAAASARRMEETRVAREMVDVALEGVRAKATARYLSPLIGELYSVYGATAQETFDRALRKELAGLPEDLRAPLQGVLTRMAKRLAHVPATGLRALANDGGIEPVRTFLTASDDPATARLSQLAAGGPIAQEEGTG